LRDEKPLTLPQAVLPADSWERTELRARVIRVGGEDPTVKLESRSEAAPFVVALINDDDARTLGANLYGEVDVELRLQRGPEGLIKGGDVLAVHPMDRTAKPIESWRAWFKDNAGDWEQVDNILVELGRTT
jgi:hypothetical protein